MGELRTRLYAVIEEEDFNFLEVAGFKSDYKLSLLAGALIGYRLVMKELPKFISEAVDERA